VLLVAIFVYLVYWHIARTLSDGQAFAPTADDPPEQPALQAALRTALPRPERWAQAARRVLNQPAQGSAEWIFCAPQWQECHCQGKIRWGSKTRWQEIPADPSTGEAKVKCDISNLQDIAPGDAQKHCQCSVRNFRSINPGLLPRQGAEVASGLQAASCEIFEAGAWQGFRAAAVQWEAVQPLCQPKLWETQGLAEAGPKALDGALVQHLLKAWVDPRFVGNYVRLYNASGWIPRAFVNYYSGATGGKIQRMTEELIKSVHSFSVHPIVVVHYGMTPAPHWTQEDYPRLVLLNAAPIPPHAERSFHFNKFRAMLMARALTGVELDSDQFVAPGVDALFDRTEEEVTRDYPLPILPAHFWPYGPEDKNLGGPALWSRYCPASDCKWQSARWGHAHPTWTFWALPFLGRWLRRNFRDETLPARRDSQMPPLRVTSVTEDEDLLNAGTWEEEGFKQWCKFDLPDPSEFRTLLDSPAAALKCQGHGCGDIQGDPRFNAGGVAKVFYTAHHAVDPDESKRFVQEILKRHRQGSLPPPILYRGRFFRDGRELKRAHPTLECLI